MNKKELKDYMKKLGYSLYLETSNNKFFVFIKNNSGVSVEVNLETLDFKFSNAVQLVRLNLGWAGPVTNEKHFKKLEGQFIHYYNLCNENKWMRL